MKNTLCAFCLKVVLLVVILFGVDRLVGAAFVKMKDVGLATNPENMWLKTPFTVEKVDADVVVIGSSKASHHYVPQMLEDSLGMTAYNCGQDGCFFLYQNCIINMILDRYTPKTIIWDIQPASFVSKDLSSEYQNIRYLSPYYPNSYWAELYINSESPKTRFKMMSRMFAYNSKLLNYIFPLVSHSSETEKGYIPLAVSENKYPDFKKEKNESHSLNGYFFNVLDNTIIRCSEKGVELRLYISPEYSGKATITISAAEEIGKLAIRNNIFFYNALSEQRFLKDATYFKDASHMNDKGARLFTNMVIEGFNE